jgi:hypothetical protein
MSTMASTSATNTSSPFLMSLVLFFTTPTAYMSMNTPSMSIPIINFIISTYTYWTCASFCVTAHQPPSPTLYVSQPHFEASVRLRLALPKVGTWSPPGLVQLQSSIAEVKTPCIEMFFIPLERPWSLDVENGLEWAIWTSTAQVMVKRRAGSQTGSLTPDHKKSGIDPTPVCAEGVRHTVGKLLRRATRLL